MTKKIKFFLGVAILATALLISCGKKCDKNDISSECYEAPCDKTDPNSECYDPAAIAVESITLDQSSLTLEVGGSFNLTATVLPANADNKTVTWSTSVSTVASVANGKVTALTAGTATITAKAGNKTANCVVTVKDPFIYDEGVMINGIKWATHNVDAPGNFASAPESAGKFYQWNRKKGWAATGEITGWDSSVPTGTTWEAANNPCPTGWRVPTIGELDGLASASSTWTTKNGMNGRLFGSGNNTIFLPAAGSRNDSDGTLGYVGSRGDYWSSTQYNESYAYLLSFISGNVITGGNDRSFGFSVRCVAE